MNNKFIKTSDPAWVKDPHSFAIINTDNTAYQQFLLERERMRRIDQLENQVKTLSSDIGDIKQLLTQLVNGKQDG